MQIVSQTLLQSWRIKDNSIYIDDFYFYRPDGNLNNATKFNYNIYTSKGNVEEISLNEEDLEKCIEYFSQLSNFITPKSPIISKEEIVTANIHLSHKQEHYNESNRVERAIQFNWKARSESSIPIKITNYISFLECLFSSSGTELVHQVSERVSLFLHEKDNTINKIETYKLIKSCYDIRSKYVHGSKLDKKKFNTLESLQKISSQLDEICRLILNIIVGEDLLFFDEDDLSSFFLNMIFKDN